MRISWFGFSVRVDCSKTVFVDPYSGPDEWYVPDSIMLVSRFERCNFSLARRGDHILGSKGVSSEFFPFGVLNFGEKKFFDDVVITGVPGRVNSKSVLCFLVEDKKSVFVMGDSDLVQDYSPDVLLIWVGDTTSAVRRVVDMVNYMNPKLVIPFGWDRVGSKDHALLFSDLVKCPCKVVEPGEFFEF